MLTRDSLAERLAYRYNYAVKPARALVDAMLEVWRKELLAGNTIHLPGVLLLEPKIHEPRPLGGALRGKMSKLARVLDVRLSERMKDRLKARAKELLR